MLRLFFYVYVPADPPKSVRRQLEVKTQIKWRATSGFIQRKKNQIGNYNLWPIDIYNWLSQIYCIKPEAGKNPLDY